MTFPNIPAPKTNISKMDVVDALTVLLVALVALIMIGQFLS